MDNTNNKNDESLENNENSDPKPVKKRKKIVLNIKQDEQHDIINNINSKALIDVKQEKDNNKNNLDSVENTVNGEIKDSSTKKKFISKRKKTNVTNEEQCNIETDEETVLENKEIVKENISEINNITEENKEITEELVQEETKPLPPPETIEFNDLKDMKPEELIDMAEKYNVQNIAELNKQDMVYAILKNFSSINPANIIIGEGVLEVLPDGFGFLRSQYSNYVAGPDDIYVSPNQIKKFGLRTGDLIKGEVKAPKKGEKYFSLVKIIEVNFKDPLHLRTRLRFDDLTPLYPDEKLQLENEEAYLKNKR